MGGARGVPAAGDLLAGRYVVEGSIGSGGMGVVLGARDTKGGHRPVALKLMHAFDAENPVSVERFFREARAAGRLDNPFVTRVFDTGRLDDGRPFMVMERLEGEDLAKRLRRGRLPWGEAALYARQAALACVAAHAAGVVHRDIKPSNIFLVTRAGCVKLVDFGISKMQGLSGTAGFGLTASGDLTGSPLYMSPEQLRAKDVDGRSDVWSLGATLYELVTGARPFQAENMMAECNRILVDAPDAPSKHAPGVPRALDEIVLRCLQKPPEKRFATAAELAEALAPLAVDVKSSTKPAKRSKGWILATLVVAALGGGGAAAWRAGVLSSRSPVTTPAWSAPAPAGT